MALTDYYELRLVHGYNQSISLLSVWHFQNIAGAGSAQHLANTFNTEVLPGLANLLTDKIDFERIEVDHLFNTTDFYVLQSLSENEGNVVQDAMPPGVTVGLRFPTTDRAIRVGYKRFSGASEDSALNGFLTTASVNVWQTWANTLMPNIDSGDGIAYRVVIIKRIKYTTPSGKPAYRLPNSLAEMGNNLSVPTSVVVVNALGSQNSRKPGRGQ